MKVFSALSLSLITFFSLSLLANETDQKIEKLKNEIQQLKLKQMEKEVESQGPFLYSYKEFADDTEQAESYEVQVERKEQELELLEKQRS